MRDEKLPRKGCFILNLDEASDPGTHWTAVYNDEYYDSFGLSPPNEISRKIKLYNNVQHQMIDSKLCGLYAAFYIYARNQGYLPYEICYNILKENSKQKVIAEWLRMNLSGTV